MQQQKFLEIITQLASAFPSENKTDEKLDLLLSKLESKDKNSVESEKDEHLLISEVCELTKKKRTTIWLWRKKGLLTPVGQSGKSPIYRKSDVLNYIYNSEKTE
ncbi:helix-turn-helix domain-containing protein [Chryseobacterium sp. ES2]|uniref:Helix-turn-helix domain-containing protein n=1 Tax=Chryseobacterium metallicongregator TaxID=3073042 RepID=A0ABU1E4L5_9FLAO|nr:helix-turn-helix domain-containing protein [Chryseobacterium sp. ES2]MDR4952597.1 helix-turn-helix domain-containing protein [Chryseobacterium sp. ES2]